MMSISDPSMTFILGENFVYMRLNPGILSVQTHIHKRWRGRGEEELMNNRMSCVVVLKLKQRMQVIKLMRTEMSS